MAITKNPKGSGLVFVQGHLLLKKIKKNIKFFAKEKEVALIKQENNNGKTSMA